MAMAFGTGDIVRNAAPMVSSLLLVYYVLTYPLDFSSSPVSQIQSSVASSQQLLTKPKISVSEPQKHDLVIDSGVGRTMKEDKPQILQSPVEGHVYLSPKVFQMNYQDMEENLRVYIYPDESPHASFGKLSGKYASEAYFLRNLLESRFLTEDPEEAHLFFLPISCAKMKEEDLGIEDMADTVEKYVDLISNKYPYWNRTLGADHFLVSCQENGPKATNKVMQLVKNSIRVFCSTTYVTSYIPHKDVSLPQIFQPFSAPRGGDDIEKRTTLGLWAGPLNSKTRTHLLKVWENDDQLLITKTHISRAEYYKSKFCICPVGLHANGACITDSIHYGCVPVVMSNYYDLPFNDVLDWQKFSIILRENDVEDLKKTLQAYGDEEFLSLHKGVLKVQDHFEWHDPPLKYDAFHMTMYELWLRHYTIRY